MQDPQDGGSRLGPQAIKEEDKALPPGAEYLSSRCVLFTYFQGDISAVVDEHFSRALSHTTAYPASSSHKAVRGVYDCECECKWSVCVCVCMCSIEKPVKPRKFFNAFLDILACFSCRLMSFRFLQLCFWSISSWRLIDFHMVRSDQMLSFKDQKTDRKWDFWSGEQIWTTKSLPSHFFAVEIHWYWILKSLAHLVCVSVRVESH